MQKRKTYTPAFKAEAVKLVLDTGKPASRVAEELGLPHTTLVRWVRQVAGIRPKTGRPVDDKEEIARLQREVDQLKQERDFLKKAVAFFAKGNT